VHKEREKNEGVALSPEGPHKDRATER